MITNQTLKLTPLLCEVFKFLDSLFILSYFFVPFAKRVSLAQSLATGRMKRTILIDVIILLCALPVSGVIAWLALAAGLASRYGEVSIFSKIICHTFAPVSSPIMTCDAVQTIILAGPSILFLIITGLAVCKGWRKTSYTFSVLSSLCWVTIVILSIYARALP